MHKADFASKHVIQPTLPHLINVLNAYDGLNWDVELITYGSFLVLQSRIDPHDGTATIATQLWIQLQPFQISAIQSLETCAQWQGLHNLGSSANDARIRLQTTPGSRPTVVWQTKERGIRYQGTATVLALEKPSTARYLGWGEQGGRSFVKIEIFMNYFSEIYPYPHYPWSDLYRLRQYGG